VTERKSASERSAPGHVDPTRLPGSRSSADGTDDMERLDEDFARLAGDWTGASPSSRSHFASNPSVRAFIGEVLEAESPHGRNEARCLNAQRRCLKRAT
jgi:hypothetical protein